MHTTLARYVQLLLQWQLTSSGKFIEIMETLGLEFFDCITPLDLRMATDSAPPLTGGGGGRGVGHFNFLLLQYIRHRMRRDSPLRNVAL